MVGQPDEPKGQKTVLKPHLFLWQQLDWCEIFLVKFFNWSRLSVIKCASFQIQNLLHRVENKNFWAFQNILCLFSTVFPYEYYFTTLVNLTKAKNLAILTCILFVQIANLYFNKKEKKNFFKKFSKSSKNNYKTNSKLM